MSDKMYDDLKIDGVKYQNGDWKKFVTHDDLNVKGFFGKYRFLSNFEKCENLVWGLYPTVENAYQAMKVSQECRPYFYTCSAYESKQNWRNFSVNPLYPNKDLWDASKYDIMFSAVFDKFLRNKSLGEKLVATQSRYIEETNWWEDEYWGVNYFNGVGTNHLGQILQKVRVILLGETISNP